MKTRIILLASLIIIFSALRAQDNDKKSKDVLDKLSTKFKAYTSLKLEFTYSMKNKTEGIDETVKGILYLKKEKYRIELPEQIIICDGKTVWTVLKDVQEVHISPFEESDDVITPQNIFTIYEKGHKSKHIREGEDKGKKVHVVELVPKTSKEYTKVRLNIEISSGNLVSAVVFDRNGNTFTYELTKTQPDIAIDDDLFTFNKAAFAKFEVIDLR